MKENEKVGAVANTDASIDEKLDAKTSDTVRGREALLGIMKNTNPEYAPDDDDMFLDDVHNLYNETNDKLSKMENGNKLLAEAVMQNPSFGAMITLILEGKHPEYARAKVYGDSRADLDDEAGKAYDEGLAEYEKQQSAIRAEMEEASKNWGESEQRIADFIKQEGLSEEEATQLRETLIDDIENNLTGVIPEHQISGTYKRLKYDNDISDASQSGYAEGKTEKVRLLKKRNESPVPDLGGGASRSAESKRPQTRKQRGSFYDELV